MVRRVKVSVVAGFLSLVALFGAACSSATPQHVAGDDVPGAGDDVQPQPDANPPTSVDAGPTYRFLCDAPVPANAPQPSMPALPAAGCPTLVPGTNTITTHGTTRSFILAVPANVQPSEKLPALFMWHWLGGSANKFLEKGQVQAAVDDQRFIAILPVSKGASILGTSFDTKWPFDITQTQDRMNEELGFFDDMLACVNAQYTINQQCISTVGVSAGALFTDQLAQARSTTLASFLSLSGGVSATIIKPWSGAARKLPGVVLWGGDGPPMMDGNKDILGCFGIGMDFSVASRALETKLTDDGHFLVECRHNCGHVEPPLDAYMDESKYAAMWKFAFDHPFWLQTGTSPYQTAGLPPEMPAWCSIGAGTSTPRSGAGCPMAENPCVN